MKRISDETEACQFIITLIYERSGIHLHDGKSHLIKARLAKRMRHHGYETLPEYCEFLRNCSDEDEMTEVVDALTTNFTHFLREEDHFKFLTTQAIPGLLKPGQKQFNIWSAGCATGEEPYSMAMYLSEHFPVISGWDWHILASDISTRALGKAKQGVYSTEKLADMPKEWVRKYFQKGVNQWDGYCRLKSAILDRISFRQINLLGDYGLTNTFEVVFCRNVMIYFDRETQEKLVKHLAQHIVPKGYLLVGHSESLTGLNVPLKCLRPSVFQKN